ncbi:MAG: hypothetical protein ABI882_06955 [Acidobacteriota bacterium]
MRTARPLLCSVLVFLCLFALSGCNAADASSAVPAAQATPCSLAFAAHSGDDRLDHEISGLQAEARKATDSRRALERLGWSFVEKARVSNDPGFYRLAEQCALCIQSTHPDSGEALLLRGHALGSMHRFKEAEPLARRLVATRKLPFDYGLLGDLLMEQGRLEEATSTYQSMMNLKPGPQAYSRAAHMRWLKGDLEGAIQMMRLAATASAYGDTEAGAWALSRLAVYEFQAGNIRAANQACNEALGLQPNYAPALLIRGRLDLAAGKPEAAVLSLVLAAKLNPLPEYQWTLAEALRQGGKEAEARAVEATLLESGAANDSRTFAVYLATKGIQPARALSLAEAELKTRADVFTFDTLAWAQAAAGQTEAAYTTIQKALAEGTVEARLLYHAAFIAKSAGRPAESRRYRRQAQTIQQMLLPSEREQLSQQTIN